MQVTILHNWKNEEIYNKCLSWVTYRNSDRWLNFFGCSLFSHSRLVNRSASPVKRYLRWLCWQPYTFRHCEVDVRPLFSEDVLLAHLHWGDCRFTSSCLQWVWLMKAPIYHKGLWYIANCNLGARFTDGWRERGRASSCLKIATCLRCMNCRVDVVIDWYMYIITALWQDYFI